VPQDWVDYEYALRDTTEFQTETVFDSLSPNIYPVWVKTPNGCIKFLEAVILNSKREIVLDTLNVDHTTCGQDNGEIDLEVIDAIGTPFISINGNLESDNLTYENLEEGTYSFVVTDDEGCQDSLEVIIDPSVGVLFADTLINQPTCGLDNGSIELGTNDQGGSYTLEVNGQLGELDNFDLPSGEYNFVVTDEDGCVDETSIVLEPSEPVAIIELDSVATSCAIDNGIVIIEEVLGSPTEYSIDGI